MTTIQEPTIAQKEPEVQVQSTQPVTNSEPAKPESVQDINWKNFREQREIERKAKAEAEKRATEKEAEAQALKAAMDAILNKNQPQQQNNFQEEESEDQRIQKKVDAALELRYAKDAELRRQREAQELPSRIQRDMSDFEQVCNSSNLDYLDFHYPEITAGYKHMPDSIEKWQAVYKAVKKFVPQGDTKKEQAKLENNMKKPGSLSTPSTLQGVHGKSPVQLDDARRAANWERMQKTIKGLS